MAQPDLLILVQDLEAMAIRSPTRRLTCSRVLCAFAFGSSLIACADVLDIPGHPHLDDQAAASASQLSSQDAGATAIVAEAPAVASGGGSMNGQGGTDVSEGETRTAPPLQTREPGTTGAAGTENRDAGTPAPSGTDPADAGVASGCNPMGSVGPNGRCFASLPALLTWAEGQQSCRALGAGWDLASIRSAEDNQFAGALLTEQAWLDGSDADVEGTWRWGDDGLAFSLTDRAGTTQALNGAYVNWNPGEPNGGGNSDCLRIVPALAATWADLQCDMLLGALCEGPTP